MNTQRNLKMLAIAAGTALTAGAAAIPAANAGQNPFSMTELSSGYSVAGIDLDVVRFADGKCGSNKEKEGKCGEDKQGEGKCGEGKCGENK
ncbi:MAG: hypothetical protein H0V62_14995 [Gammaproteobacteria bacterium]|nr:hypothetical protein [Gammaproteobacteria bacterium]